MKIAFIGTGKMGAPMVRHLVAAGHQVTAHNRTRRKAEGLGSAVADSPAEAARGADVAVTMLPDDGAVEEVVFGPDGIGDVPHIGCSTISTRLGRRLAAASPAGYITACVFGRPDAAEAGRLIVVVAGRPELIERFGPLFEAVGRRTLVAGREPWQANATKVCGNFMLASMVESFGEAYTTLGKAGVDPHLFLEVMVELFGSPVYANYGKLIAERQFDPPGFELKLGLKDVRLLVDTATECMTPMPVASLIRDRMLDAVGHGQGAKDWSSFALWGR